MGIIESPIFWIVVAAASEIIALTPLKSNSVIQLVLSAIDAIKPAKKGCATYRVTVNGFFGLTLEVRPKNFVVQLMSRSSMQLCLTN